MKKINRGFTLIELLIVIALLGALAVGLLAALDPFEQLKKGTDTGIRNTVSEIHGAMVRYYAIKTYMPWSTQIGGAGSISGIATSFSSDLLSAIDAGELKADFFALATNQLSSITMVGTEESLTVCFQPKSKSFRSDNNTKYGADGVDGQTGCPSATATTCYWCVR